MSRNGGHGGRGHQVSPKQVRARRAAGIQPKRGHNFDSRLRNERGQRIEAAAAKGYDESATAIVARLLSRFGIGPTLRDDIEQEIWVRLLEGQSEAEIAATVPRIRSHVSALESPKANVSLDAPMGEAGLTLAERIDERGHVYRHHASPFLSPQKLREKHARKGRGQARVEARAKRKAEQEAARLAVVEARAKRKAEQEARQLSWWFYSRVRAAAREVEQLNERVNLVRTVRDQARVERRHVQAAELAQRQVGRAFMARVRENSKAATNGWGMSSLDNEAYAVLPAQWHRGHPDHGIKHRRWWDQHPEAREAMREKNRLVWAMKGEEISLKLQRSGRDWWDAHPEERVRRGEIMRQAWARRRAAALHAEERAA